MGVDKYSKDFMWDVDPLEWKEELKSLLRNAFLGQGRTHAFLLYMCVAAVSAHRVCPCRRSNDTGSCSC